MHGSQTSRWSASKIEGPRILVETLLSVLLWRAFDPLIGSGEALLLSLPLPSLQALPTISASSGISLIIAVFAVFMFFNFMDRRKRIKTRSSTTLLPGPQTSERVGLLPGDTFPRILPAKRWLEEFPEKFQHLKDARTPQLKAEMLTDFDSVMTGLPTSSSDGWDRNVSLRVSDILKFIESDWDNSDQKTKETYLEWLELISRKGDRHTLDLMKGLFLEKINRSYVRSDFELNHRLLVLRQAFHNYEEKFMKELLSAAVHNWSDLKFDALYSSIGLLQVATRDKLVLQHLKDHLFEIMAKADRENDQTAYRRAKRLLDEVKGL